MILKRLIPILLAVPLLAACPSGNPNGKMPVDVSKLPRQIYSGEQGPFHVQGIAVDLDRGYMYFSFTTTLLKTDMQGNLLGSVEGMTGHLGCMTLNPDDGRLYASIEYKHDAIGKGILNKLEGVRNDEQTGFYVAVFDVDRIDRIGMNAEKDDVMKTVYIKEAVVDYYAKVSNNGQELEHRFGCSGIDGVTFAPAFGQSRDGKKYLYVAYGIYGDTLRTDNDYQVILAYDTRDWKRYEQPLTQENLHKSGPEKPEKIAVLMSTYNGEEFLRDQIESILNQEKVNVTLYVRDDGSSDRTVEILSSYEEQGKLKLICGKNCGVGNSFMHLLYTSDQDFDFYAFSDQDDIWLPDKLYSA